MSFSHFVVFMAAIYVGIFDSCCSIDDEALGKKHCQSCLQYELLLLQAFDHDSDVIIFREKQENP